MLNEHFLNLLGYGLLKDDKIFKKTPKLIQEILDYYKNEIDIDQKNKINLLYFIINKRLKNEPIDSILDEILSNEKFEDLKSFIDQIQKKELTKSEKEKVLNKINQKKKLIEIFKSYPEFNKFREDFENNNFNDSEELIKSYEKVINRLYKDIVQNRRNEDHQKNETLDLLDDDYENVINEIEKSYKPGNLLSSGYEFLDNTLLGGFQEKRIYIFAGSSGDGKSTLMINLMKNFINQKFEKNKDTENVIFYFTFENQIDESFLRFYCSFSGREIKDVIKEILIDKHKVYNQMKNEIKQTMLKNNIRIIFDYFKPKTIFISDLIDKIDEYKSKFNKDINVVAIIIDYLDQMNIDNTIKYYDNYRFVLGHITTDMKILSITMKTPVISVTQVNRSGYDKKNKKEITMIGESIQKVENSDFIGLVTFVPISDQEYEQEEEENVHTKFNDYNDQNEGVGTFIIDVEKNRSGPKHKRIYLNADFKKFLITDKKSTSKSALSFETNNEKNIFNKKAENETENKLIEEIEIKGGIL